MKSPIKKIILVALPLFVAGAIYLSVIQRSPTSTPSAGLIKNGTGGLILSGVYLTYDKDIVSDANNGELDEALKSALKRFDDNNGKNLGDYDELMWIYIDRGEYAKVIELGEKSMALLGNAPTKEPVLYNLYKRIISSMLQAHLYTGDLRKAEHLMNKHKDIDFIFEKIVLEYKKGNYDYLINNYDKIEQDSSAYIGFDLDLLAKSYLKKGDLNNAIRIQEEIFNYGNLIFTKGITKNGTVIAEKDAVLGILYLYMSTSNLRDLYLEKGDKAKSDLYSSKFIFYKNKIDNEETIDGIKLNKGYMYFGINRIKNDL